MSTYLYFLTFAMNDILVLLLINYFLLIPQRIDWLELRSLGSWIVAERNADDNTYTER